jgi:branched-chain amino acid aminotransferase
VEEVVKAIRDGSMKEAFGAGTAATIAYIESIAYDDVEYKLPSLQQPGFANHVGQVLDQIRRGRIPDPFGWMVNVK